MTLYHTVSVSVPSYLGDRLHKALKLYFYNKRTRMSGHYRDWVKLQLDNHFVAMRKLLKVADGDPVGVGDWTEAEIRTWVLAGVDWIDAFCKKEDISWFREEWGLPFVYLDEAAGIATHLGEPDLVAYGKVRKRYMVLDYKNASSTAMYVDDDGTIRRSPTNMIDKLLGYAFGARFRFKKELKRRMKPITVGYLVFIRDKVTPATPLQVHLVTEDVTPQQLEGWRRRMVAQFFQ
ncbi:MAG: hypothetical protein GC134_09915 [Proteobacteria bacterium]|nr:hypothetical protein [Pseudomonadota bacterium]